MSEIHCECGSVFSSKSSFYSHKSRTCVLNTNKTVYECDICSKTFTRKDGLNNHKKKVHSSELDLTNSNNSQTITTTTESHNTTTNSHNSTTNKVIYNINYVAPVDKKTIVNKILETLGPKYLRKGDERFASFILREIFTDPDDFNNRSIKCLNYKEHNFIYNIVDNNGEPETIDDAGFKKFINFFNKFNTTIQRVTKKFTESELDCYVKSSVSETRKNMEKLYEPVINRTKIPSFLAKEIRSLNNNKSNPIFDDTLTPEEEQEEINEITQQEQEKLERDNKAVYNTYNRTLDEEIKHKEYLYLESQYNPAKERFNKSMKGIKNPQFEWCDIQNKPVIIGSYIKQNKEEDKQFEEKVRQEKQEKEEKERLRQQRKEQAQKHKEEMKRADAIVKTQAIREQIDKKKQKVLRRINKQSISPFTELLDTIEEEY